MKLRNKKTGEYGRLKMCHDGDKYPLYIEVGELSIYYHNFADMIEAGWDCAKIPAEPLIKNKEVRKAIREWAVYNGVREVFYFTDGQGGSRLDAHTVTMGFYNELRELKECKKYTIAELCGEGVE